MDGNITYREALIASWAVLWRSVLLAISMLWGVLMLLHRDLAFSSVRDALDGAGAQFIFQLALTVIGLFCFLPLLISLRSPQFKINLLAGPVGSSVVERLTLSRRLRLWVALSWRLTLGAIMALCVATVLNVILLMFGVSSLAIVNLAVAFGIIFVVGPVTVILLAGRQFADFRLEVQRPTT